MASDRSKAKEDVVPNSAEMNEPASLQSVLSSAQTFRLELAKKKEDNRHAETMKDKELSAAAKEHDRALGAFGRFLGGSANAPVAIAAVAVVAGIIFAAFCFFEAAGSQVPNPWFHEAEWAGAFTASSLSFIFGRAGKS